jgi:hypothetical protein
MVTETPVFIPKGPIQSEQAFYAVNALQELLSKARREPLPEWQHDTASIALDVIRLYLAQEAEADDGPEMMTGSRMWTDRLQEAEALSALTLDS